MRLQNYKGLRCDWKDCINIARIAGKLRQQSVSKRDQQQSKPVFDRLQSAQTEPRQNQPKIHQFQCWLQAPKSNRIAMRLQNRNGSQGLHQNPGWSTIQDQIRAISRCSTSQSRWNSWIRAQSTKNQGNLCQSSGLCWDCRFEAIQSQSCWNLPQLNFPSHGTDQPVLNPNTN